MRTKLFCCALLLLLGACNGDDGGSGSGSNRTEGTAPNACEAISADELSEIAGKDQGKANDMTAADSRSVCLYDSGTILAIEVAGNYEATRAVAGEQGTKTEDVDGVGKKAYTDPSGQIVALGDNYFVAVTVRDADQEKNKEVAKKMLEAIE